MSQLRVSTDVDLPRRIAAVRAAMRANGVNVSEWARDHGFDVRLVHQVLRGNRACRFGESHRIAVALGVKQRPATQPVAANQSSMAIAA